MTKKLGKQLDRLTVAYIAIGMMTAWNKRGEVPVGYGAGQLEFIDEGVRFTEQLDALWNEDLMVGCWLYEVAEPFGEQLAEQMYEQYGEEWVKYRIGTPFTFVCDMDALFKKVSTKVIADARRA